MDEFEAFDESNAINEEEYYVDMTMMETCALISLYGATFFVTRLPDTLKDDLYHALDRERNAFPE